MAGQGVMADTTTDSASGGSYPSSSGIPIVASGTSWGTTIAPGAEGCVLTTSSGAYVCSTTITITSIGAGATIITPAITSKEVYIDCTGSAAPYAYCTSSSAATFAAAQVSRTVINSYNRGGAQTDTLPAAAEGYTFIALVGTQHNSAWKIQRAGADTITWSAAGTDTAGKTYFQETNQGVGSRVSCITYKTGASAWSWLCGSVTGTWVTD
jgi:hypothetical protein